MGVRQQGRVGVAGRLIMWQSYQSSLSNLAFSAHARASRPARDFPGADAHSGRQQPCHFERVQQKSPMRFLKRRTAPEGTPSQLPPYNRFTQQELPAYRPILSPSVFIAATLAIGCIFIPVVEVRQRYDDVCLPGNSDADRESALTQLSGAGSVCNVSLPISKTMRPPVLVYYALDGFQQNHRRYVRSRSDAQLRGDSTTDTTSYCEPQEFLAANKSLLIRPCGLAAWSLFNDTFQVSSGARPIGLDETGISWPEDRRHKYASIPAENFNTDPSLRGGAAIPGNLDEDEHFIVWMRSATLPNFRKLWGRIRQEIAADTVLTVTIANRYNTYRFGGRKYVLLTTTNRLGGRNPFLGIAYLAVGGASVLLGLTMAVTQCLFRRKPGDLSRLSWKRPPPSKRRDDLADLLDLDPQ